MKLNSPITPNIDKYQMAKLFQIYRELYSQIVLIIMKLLIRIFYVI